MKVPFRVVIIHFSISLALWLVARASGFWDRGTMGVVVYVSGLVFFVINTPGIVVVQQLMRLSILHYSVDQPFSQALLSEVIMVGSTELFLFLSVWATGRALASRPGLSSARWSGGHR